MYLVLDFETSSEAELRDVGLYNYATHPTTRVLMLSYAFVEKLSEKPIVKRWEPRNGKVSMPSDLAVAIRDTNDVIIAFNSAFERNIFKHVLGISIPIERFQDPQA